MVLAAHPGHCSMLSESHLIPAPKGCIRLALLPPAPDDAASISNSSLSEPFLPFAEAALVCLAV